jgi:hypothetical protein
MYKNNMNPMDLSKTSKSLRFENSQGSFEQMTSKMLEKLALHGANRIINTRVQSKETREYIIFFL